jgi:dipeptidase E
MRKLLLVSTSSTYNSGYLEHCEQAVIKHFMGIKKITFIPFARPSGITEKIYTEKVRQRFNDFGIEVVGLNEVDDKIELINKSEGVFTGGGNTFLLLTKLIELNLIESLRKKIYEGMPYMGTSAGSNIAGLTIGTTNDMPIIYPPSFNALGVVRFNLNPHYLDPIEGSTHMGETRETRIKEFHFHNDQPVIGLREGSWLEIIDEKIELGGKLSARLFKRNSQAIEIEGNLNFIENW